MNKRRLRTEALIQATARRRMHEQADNTIEQHNFDKLVRSGVIVEDKQDMTEVFDGGTYEV